LPIWLGFYGTPYGKHCGHSGGDDQDLDSLLNDVIPGIRGLLSIVLAIVVGAWEGAWQPTTSFSISTTPHQNRLLQAADFWVVQKVRMDNVHTTWTNWFVIRQRVGGWRALTSVPRDQNALAVAPGQSLIVLKTYSEVQSRHWPRVCLLADNYIGRPIVP